MPSGRGEGASEGASAVEQRDEWDGPVPLRFFDAVFPGKITSPNKVVWSHGAAYAGSAKRRRLRLESGIRVQATGAHLTPRSAIYVTLSRIAPRRFDFDNMVAGFKPVRDGVADAFGLFDDHPLFRWDYQQRTGKPKQYAIAITIGIR